MTGAGTGGGRAGAEPAAAGFGHGKVILLGEHAVVYGRPALAAGLDKGVHAVAQPGAGRITIASWSLEARVGDGSPVGRAAGAIVERLGGADRDLALTSDLPPGAGLGSSAALAVAVARALGAGRPDDETQRAVADAETIFHGNASGIDAAAAWSGTVGRFVRGEGWRAVDVLQPMTLCVGLSGRPRETAAQVAHVARLRERTPAVDLVLDGLAAVTESGVEALARGDVDGLGRLFDVAHGLLAALRVSSPELDALVHAARAAGAVGAKLTGAGGGGAVIALAPGHEKDVLRRWRDAGFAGFLATVGGAPHGAGTHARAGDDASDGHSDGARESRARFGGVRP